jgi:hypothetical protein
MGAAAGLMAYLRRRGEPLFAVLDAARDDRVLAWLYESGLEHHSLYEGPKGDVLADVAPYLVRLELDAPLLRQLVEEGWGQAFGVLVTSRARPKDVRSRLRRLLMVQTESSKQVYFRFYDPRVLRVFLPIATPRQVSWFFGGGEMGAYVLEDRDPAGVLVFTEASEGVLARHRVERDGEEGGPGARAG